MPINVRSFAIKAATLWFFLTAFVGWMNELEPFECCRKAFVGFICVYIISEIACKIINKIVFEALVSKAVDQMTNKEKKNDTTE